MLLSKLILFYKINNCQNTLKKRNQEEENLGEREINQNRIMKQ